MAVRAECRDRSLGSMSVLPLHQHLQRVLHQACVRGDHERVACAPLSMKALIL